MSYRDISRWATIRIVSRRIDTVSIYRHIVSSLVYPFKSYIELQNFQIYYGMFVIILFYETQN